MPDAPKIIDSNGVGAQIAVKVATLLVACLAIAGGVHFALTTKSADPAPPAALASSADHWMAVRDGPSEILVGAARAVLTLKASMRNPASFQLIQAIAGAGDAVCFRFRAQNGFGGMDVERAFSDGKSVHVESGDYASFWPPWHKACDRASDEITDSMQAALAADLP